MILPHDVTQPTKNDETSRLAFFFFSGPERTSLDIKAMCRGPKPRNDWSLTHRKEFHPRNWGVQPEIRLGNLHKLEQVGCFWVCTSIGHLIIIIEPFPFRHRKKHIFLLKQRSIMGSTYILSIIIYHNISYIIIYQYTIFVLPL